MNKTLVTLAAAVVVGGGLVAYFVMSSNDKNSEVASNTSQGTSTPTEKPATNTAVSINDVSSSGKPQECKFTYSGPNGNGDSVMFTDGAGKSRMEMQLQTSQGNTGTMVQIMLGTKAYSITETGGKKIGLMMDTSNIAANQPNTAGSSTIPTDTKFTMDCKDWTVDTTKFIVPTDVEFVTLPTAQ